MTDRYNARVLSLAAAEELAAEVAMIESYADAVPRVAAKARHRLVRVERLDATAAMILKQELLARGADALISPQVYLGDRDALTDALIFGSARQLEEVAGRLAMLPLAPLQQLAAELRAVLAAYDHRGGALDLGGGTLSWGRRTYVMGIVNVTPDSFSADGLLAAPGDPVAAALAQARRFADEGADLLDVGGESTRPGAAPVAPAEERARVVPVVAALARELPLPVSVDSYRAEVVAAALDAGARLVNDVWGLRTPEGGWNTELADLVAARGVPIVLMHNRRAQATQGALGGHYRAVEYGDLMGELIGGLRERLAFAEARGIPRDRIIVDPGIGFGKTPQQNLVLVRRLAELRSLGLPVLVGASRKSFIGLTLGLAPHERDEGTAAVTALAVQAGADIVRVHNVQANVRAARLADAIFRQPASDPA